MSPSWDRRTWSWYGVAIPGQYPVVCHVCANPGKYTATTLRWVCWDCKEALTAQKALCGSHVTGTYNGPEFSDGSVFLGFFVD